MIRVIDWPTISAALQPKNPLRRVVPRVHPPVERLSDDGVVRRGDDRGQPCRGEVGRLARRLEHQLEHARDPAVGVGEQGRPGDEGRPAAVRPLGDEQHRLGGPALGQGARHRARRGIERLAVGGEQPPGAAPARRARRRAAAPEGGGGSVVPDHPALGIGGEGRHRQAVDQVELGSHDPPDASPRARRRL